MKKKSVPCRTGHQIILAIDLHPLAAHHTLTIAPSGLEKNTKLWEETSTFSSISESHRHHSPTQTITPTMRPAKHVRALGFTLTSYCGFEADCVNGLYEKRGVDGHGVAIFQHTKHEDLWAYEDSERRWRIGHTIDKSSKLAGACGYARSSERTGREMPWTISGWEEINGNGGWLQSKATFLRDETDPPPLSRENSMLGREVTADSEDTSLTSATKTRQSDVKVSTPKRPFPSPLQHRRPAAADVCATMCPAACQ